MLREWRGLRIRPGDCQGMAVTFECGRSAESVLTRTWRTSPRRRVMRFIRWRLESLASSSVDSLAGCLKSSFQQPANARPRTTGRNRSLQTIDFGTAAKVAPFASGVAKVHEGLFQHPVRARSALAAVLMSVSAFFPLNAPHAADESAAQAWRTYSNPRLAFSFDHPATWTVIESDRPEMTDAVFVVKMLSPDLDVPVMRERTPGSFMVEVFANPRQLSTQASLDARGWPFGNDRSVTPTTIAGVTALDISTGRMFAPNRYMYIARNGCLFRLSPLAAESQKILESFRFESSGCSTRDPDPH